MVVPLNGSPLAETALALACALARRFDTEVALVSACAVSEAAEMDAYLAGLVHRLSAEVLSVRAVLPPAQSAEGIRGELAFVPPTLIVMTTHWRASLGALLHPSGAWNLFTQATAPILACKVWGGSARHSSGADATFSYGSGGADSGSPGWLSPRGIGALASPGTGQDIWGSAHVDTSRRAGPGRIRVGRSRHLMGTRRNRKLSQTETGGIDQRWTAS